MAAAAAAIKMRRMETVLTAGERRLRPVTVGAKAYRSGHVYPTAGPGSPAKRR
jgi:hypothetical protein